MIDIWQFLCDAIKIESNNQKSISMSSIVKIVQNNLNLKKVKYCSIFSIVHQLISDDKSLLIEKSNLNS